MALGDFEVAGVVGRCAFDLDAPVIPVETHAGCVGVILLKLHDAVAGDSEDFVAVPDEDGPDEGAGRVYM